MRLKLALDKLQCHAYIGGMTNTPATESVVRYELTVWIVRPVRYDLEAPMAEQKEWAVSADAKRELEREVLRALRKLDGDCDCEVLAATIVPE